MRRYSIGVFVVLVLAAMLPARARAEGAGGIRLDEKGTVTLVSSQMAEDEVSTMSFSISVDAVNAESAEFLFSESGAKILEYRYNREEKKLDVYIAGNTPLFSAGANSLTLGRVVVRDGNGGSTSATASVSAESLQYVYGTEVRMVEGMESSGAVEIKGTDTDSQPTQPPTQPTQPPTQPTQPTQPPTQPPTPSPKPQNPPDKGNDDDDDDNSQDTNNSVTAGNPQGTARPQKTPKPVATKVPVVHVPQSTARPTSSPVATTQPPKEDEEDIDVEQSAGATSEQAPESSDSQEEESESGGKIDWVWVLAVGGIVIFAGVAVLAFVTLSRKPEQ